MILLLDKYKSGQDVAYNIMINAINNNKISHAYLIDSNGNPDVMDIVLSFVKKIISLDFSDNDVDNIFKRIDEGNYLDVKIIEPDGMWIKKDQLLDLQGEFSKKAVEGKRKIYIIKSADKMNVQTANSILKFLEEPIDDIVAFLVVNNINLILPTIISRCQVIKLNRKEYYDNSILNFSYLFSSTKYGNIDESEKIKIIDNIINFILYVENNGYDTIIYTKKLWHSIFKDRDANLIAIELIINFYYDVLKYNAGNNVNFFKDRLADIEDVSNKNDITSLARKIRILDETKNGLKGNLNINLLIDKLIIDMCGDKNENSRC